MTAPRLPLPALALCAALLWPLWNPAGVWTAPMENAATASGEDTAGKPPRTPDHGGVNPARDKSPLLPPDGAAAEDIPALSPLTLRPVTEVERRHVPPRMPWDAAYAHARSTAWLAAVRKAALSLPQRREIRMGAVSPAERLALAAQLYTAAAPPPGAKKADPLRVTVTLQPRLRPGRHVLLALRNPDLTELRRMLMGETETALERMNRHWPGGPPDGSAGPDESKTTLSLWNAGDWTRMGKCLDGLWLAQSVLALTPEGWLTAPDALPVLEKAALLAPRSPAVRLLLAEAQLQRGLPQQSVESCNEALRLDPSLARARYIRALGHWRLQQLALAEDDLSAALAVKSKTASQDFERARLLRARGAVRLLRRNYADMCEDFTAACALGDCEGLAVARNQGYCRARESTEDSGPEPRTPAVLPPAFFISPPGNPALSPTLEHAP